MESFEDKFVAYFCFGVTILGFTGLSLVVVLRIAGVL